MNIEEFRNYCIQKPYTTEEFPFDNIVLVFKVKGKIFALVNVDSFESINLKCDPVKAVVLREKYDAVQPGYHMNKKHWNTIAMDGEMPDEEVKYWVNHSYELVVSKLPKKLREDIHQNK